VKHRQTKKMELTGPGHPYTGTLLPYRSYTPIWYCVMQTWKQYTICIYIQASNHYKEDGLRIGRAVLGDNFRRHLRSDNGQLRGDYLCSLLCLAFILEVNIRACDLLSFLDWCGYIYDIYTHSIRMSYEYI
jgi:hypothetical protein